MQTCARCGTENTDAAFSCVTCGLPLSAAENAVIEAPVAGGARSAGGQPNSGSAKEPRQELARTVAGHLDPQLVGTVRVAPDASARPPMAATIIGLAPTPGPEAVEDRPSNATPHFARTVLGLAPPDMRGGTVPLAALSGNPDPNPSAVTPAQPASFENETPQVAEAAAPPGGPMMKTLLGVARPGIAPMNPGVPKQEPAVFPVGLPTPIGAPPLVFPNESPPNEVFPGGPRDSREFQPVASARKGRWLGLFALFGALTLAGAGVGAFLWLRGPGRIEARAVVDAEGRESLNLTCAGCKDGTRVRLGQELGTIKQGRALVRLGRKLSVGENRFELFVRAPGSDRETRVALNVPLEYRVQADTRGLEKARPALSVFVEALPGSSVAVDGKAVALNALGQATYEVDITPELSGLDNMARRLDRKVGYRINVPGGGVASGEVAFQLPIMPLTLESPGPAITIEGERFLLAGRTSKGAKVTIADRPITIDAEGQFVQPLSVSSVGETRVTLRTSAPDWAPRLFSIHVKRVASLADEGRARRTQSVAQYAALLTDLPKKVGVKVALDGVIAEVGNQPRSTLVLLDVASGCPARPCFARVVHGAPSTLAPGDKVSVFGVIHGSVEGPRAGSPIPEVFADFILKANK
ncbi:MAG TPA: hypothetical protein VFQ61_37820 [Polyangiaceae bacterium]|nr:hypothetical protein [Polyangiaceae bacterium]